MAGEAIAMSPALVSLVTLFTLRDMVSQRQESIRGSPRHEAREDLVCVSLLPQELLHTPPECPVPSDLPQGPITQLMNQASET